MKFDRYIDLLAKLENDTKFTNIILLELPKIKQLCKGLLATITHYLHGKPHKAYSCFDESVSGLSDFIYNSIRNRIKYPEEISLFRIRESDSRYLLRENIFHVPFEYRGFVRNQRFSINGYPCLYFGSSIYVCWEELNRPSFENMFVSKFRLNKHSAKILDLTFPAAQDKRILMNTEGDDDFRDFHVFKAVFKLILFPLILSCSVIEKECKNLFKEEYIIPQILLEWVTDSHGIDAIKYASMSLPDYNLDQSLFTNYVFPAKQHKNSGFCKHLIEMFELTEPISWNFAKSLNCPTQTSLNSKFDFNILNHMRSYQHTEFGHMEQVLNSMSFSKINLQKLGQ